MGRPLPFSASVDRQDGAKTTLVLPEDDEPQRCKDQSHTDSCRVERDVVEQDVDQHRPQKRESQRDEPAKQLEKGIQSEHSV